MKSKFEEAYAQLNAAQKQAVDTLDGPVLVIAGPGTGKTQLLTTRIANILTKTDTTASNILCLTFTESGAQTMRERLVNFIGQDAYDVTISTYHAFGSDLIRRFPDYFVELADTQPIDDLGADSIFREIIGALPYSNPLKYADNYLGDIRSLVSDAKRALLTPSDLRTIAKDNLAYIKKTTPLVQEKLDSIPRLSKSSIPRFADLLQALGPQPDASANNVILPLGQLFGEQLAAAVTDAEASGKTAALAAWKKTWLAKDEAGQFIIEGEKANHKLQAAADIYEAYLQALKARKLFDYDDMILRAVHALETHADLRYTLQEQYLYILLDEFQDTNGAQLKLVELLTDNPVNEGRPNVLAVGDDDQAIYAFQGANYSHMLQFQSVYRDVLLVPLTENYRSHRDILQLAGGIAEQIDERLHHHFPAINKTLVAANKQLPKNAIIERREAKSDIAQYAWVAQKIRTLLDNGVPADEIAVLAPQHKYLEPLVAFLQQAGVPLRYEKRENVLDDPAVNQLLRMAELCLALNQGKHAAANSLWAEVLSFDFWELPTTVIWQASWQASDEREQWSEVLLRNERLQPIVLFFIRLSLMVGTETLETMLDYLIGVQSLDLHEADQEPFTSPFYTFYFGNALPNAGNLTHAASNEAFWNLLTNLIVLRSRLREYRAAEGEPLTLADLTAFAQAHRDADIKILNTSPYQEATKAVQLMTAFKAKGQEYVAVFIIATNDEAWGSKAANRGSHISIPPNLQFIRYAGATNDERLRLFYVAVTRAKSELYLVNYTATYAGKGMTRLKYLNEQTEGDIVTSPLLPQGAQTILSTPDRETAPTTELAAYWQRRHGSALTESGLAALLGSRLEHFQLSATHLGDFIDIVHSGPEAFFLKSILRFPQASRPEAQFGNAIHETLEWIHIYNKREGQLPSEKATIQTFEQRLRAKRLSEQQTALLLMRGEDCLRSYLEQRSDTVAADNQCEYNFRGEGVFVEFAHLGGKIDKLIIDKTTKTISIVDYKTGRAHPRWAREISLHKYEMQLYFYKLLVEGSHSFAGYTVADAYLEFVEPDEQGHISELHVQFDEQKMQALRKLIQAVWRRIMKLDLPDVTSYSSDLVGIEAFEHALTGPVVT